MKSVHRFGCERVGGVKSTTSHSEEIGGIEGMTGPYSE